MRFEFDDGGRARAGFKGEAGDCVARSIAIATGHPYGAVYDSLAELEGSRRGRSRSARNGVGRKSYQRLLEHLGWVWTPTMAIGSGCTVHLADGELPAGALVVRLSKHITAVIDGVIHDTFDPSRDGTRCVYGYFSNGESVTVDEPGIYRVEAAGVSNEREWAAP